MIESHFVLYSSPDHICRGTLHEALSKLNGKPALILETGSSAWGSNSSLLFDAYVNQYGGSFETVDLRMEPSISLHTKCSANTLLHCDDSVHFLEQWSKGNPGVKIDLLYLDSWDVDWNNPNPSSMHGMAEFLATSGHLHSGSLLLIDDTPANEKFFASAQTELLNFKNFYIENGFYPGKGALVKALLKANGRGKEIMHQYQLLWEF